MKHAYTSGGESTLWTVCSQFTLGDFNGAVSIEFVETEDKRVVDDAASVWDTEDALINAIEEEDAATGTVVFCVTFSHASLC